MKKSLTGAILCIALSGMLFAGGQQGAGRSSARDDGTGKQPFGKYSQLVTVSVGVPSSSISTLPAGITRENNDLTNYMAQKSNIALKYAWQADLSNYDQQVALTIAGNALPDLMILRNEQKLRELIENDMVADLTGTYEQSACDYVKGFNKDFGDDAFTTAIYNGKLMAIPDLTPGCQFSFAWIRRDWLDKLGLAPPKTRADLEKIAKAFVDNDMSGDGKTVGITGTTILGQYNSAYTFDPVFESFLAYPGSWMKQANGSIVYGSIQPEMKNALQYMHDLYSKGLVDPEYIVHTTEDVSEICLSGHCGIFFGPWHISDWGISTAVVNDPDARWEPYIAPLTDTGTFEPLSQKIHSAWLVARKGYAYPEMAWHLLNYNWYCGRGLDPEFNKLSEQYRARNINISAPFAIGSAIMVQWRNAIPMEARVIDKAIKTRDISNLMPEPLAFYKQCIDWLDNKNPEAWKYYSCRVEGSLITEDPAIKVTSNVYPFSTDTMMTRWTNLKTMEDEFILKVITGREPLSSFDKFVTDWKRMGGDQITKEVNAQING
jgi:putative aldouronate transport system substrate-binding protein